MSEHISGSHNLPALSQHNNSGNNGHSPSLSELTAHYNELHEERRRLEELLAKTDDMMRGLKRGIDEIRNGGNGDGQQQQLGQQGQGSGQQGVPAMEPLNLSRRGERRREVWRVEEEAQ